AVESPLQPDVVDVHAPCGPVLVAFRVPACALAFGEHLRVVGGCAELGAWDAAKAPALGWAAGDNWAAAVAVPPGEHSFKLVIVRQDGSTYWEDGSDRSLSVAASGPPAARGTPALRATCRFGDTTATGVELEAAAEAAAEAAMKAAVKAEAATEAPAAEQPNGAANLPSAQAASTPAAEASAAPAANGAPRLNGSTPAV
ncbi:hypothetical protein COHA_010847, partial [Chlorella ohadii]